MRKLTIKRRKSIIASVISYKVYVQDNKKGTINFQGVNFRQLGKIKNGEEVTFNIKNDKLLVLVIADDKSKNYCYDLVSIEKGETPIYLEGQTYYDLKRGNPFYFDTDNEELKAKRLKTNKQGAIVFYSSLGLLAVALIVIVISMFLS